MDYKRYLTKAEIAELRKPNDSKALLMFAGNWLMIALCFVAIAWAENLLVTVLALFVMAGRQLGIGILLHECSHRNFFSKRGWNDRIGHWLGGMPLLVPMDFYRPYHMAHHSKTGTEADPDVGNIKQYPISKTSMMRKILRDFTGLSGIKILLGVLFYILPNREGNTVSMGKSESSKALSTAEKRNAAMKNYSHALLFHTLFFSCFWLAGKPWLYAYWWVCFVFVYPFILRMRQIAEHGAMTRLSSQDVRETTRTTMASWWERLLFAPNFVNYHCEHHYLPTVPSYHLPKMHSILMKKGFYDEHQHALVKSYSHVLRIATANSM